MEHQTFDEDGAVEEFLGGSKPIKYADLIKNSDVQKFNAVELVSKKGKKTGTITFET